MLVTADIRSDDTRCSLRALNIDGSGEAGELVLEAADIGVSGALVIHTCSGARIGSVSTGGRILPHLIQIWVKKKPLIFRGQEWTSLLYGFYWFRAILRVSSRGVENCRFQTTPGRDYIWPERQARSIR
jgi:hypothetical protein